MVRWTSQETQSLAILRQRLGTALTHRPQYPEVVGDRKLIRFLRGHDFNIEKVTELLITSLKWRHDNNIDQIRDNIVSGGLDHPTKFPHADIILKHMPHIVIAPYATDKDGSPIVLDQYRFSPSEIMNVITLDQYIEFVVHTLEYRQLVLEQMSEQREREYLTSLSPEEREKVENDPNITYGVTMTTCVIRDLGGIGFEHFGTNGQNIIRSVIALASDNYPELMKKCYMINTPWLFNTIWYFIKGLIAVRTINKIAIIGTSYMEELQESIDPKFIPVLVGGNYTGAIQYEPYEFDKEYFVPPPSAYDKPEFQDAPLLEGTALPLAHNLSPEDIREADEVSASMATLDIKKESPSLVTLSHNHSVREMITEIILSDATTTNPKSDE